MAKTLRAALRISASVLIAKLHEVSNDRLPSVGGGRRAMNLVKQEAGPQLLCQRIEAVVFKPAEVCGHGMARVSCGRDGVMSSGVASEVNSR